MLIITSDIAIVIHEINTGNLVLKSPLKLSEIKNTNLDSILLK